LLNGFSLTPQLLQELFGSLDPHKKGYLSYNDWKNAFSGFNYHDHLFLELKSLLTANFANYDSAYKFLLSFGTTASIDQAMFTYAVSQLSNERFKQDQLQ
jgi:Ca2+-binding EF-hand superfamily protein